MVMQNKVKIVIVLILVVVLLTLFFLGNLSGGKDINYIPI